MKSFLASLSLCIPLAATSWAHPNTLLAQAAPPHDSESRSPVLVGSGAQSFTTVPDWGDIPDKFKLGPTHGGVVVDKSGLIYTSTDGELGIVVFNADGSFVRTLAPAVSGIHGLCLREENGEEFLYAAHLKGAQILKLKLNGEAVLRIPYPEEARLGEVPAYPGGKGYKPTAVAVAPDGTIFAADGYGLSLIHKFDPAGHYLKSFGGKGKADGQFETCHGLALDTRSGQPLLLVCDRENRRLVHLDLEGRFVGVITTGLRRPCAVSILGENVAVAELEGRVAILDKTNPVVATLGDNPDKAQWAKFDVPAGGWMAGGFTAPHGLSYDAVGNLYVQDWNKTGRLTKLLKTVP